MSGYVALSFLVCVPSVMAAGFLAASVAVYREDQAKAEQSVRVALVRYRRDRRIREL